MSKIIIGGILKGDGPQIKSAVNDFKVPVLLRLQKIGGIKKIYTQHIIFDSTYGKETFLPEYEDFTYNGPYSGFFNL